MLEDTTDLAEMQDGILEEHQTHSLAGVLTVVFGQVFTKFLRKSIKVINLHVLALCVIVISEDDLFDVGLLPLQLEVVL